MQALIRFIGRLTDREEGQTLTEYGLLLFFIAVVAIVAVTFLGDEISRVFNSVATTLQGANP
jgi:pilus assembly protein Flp/PilA